MLSIDSRADGLIDEDAMRGKNEMAGNRHHSPVDEKKNDWFRVEIKPIGVNSFAIKRYQLIAKGWMLQPASASWTNLTLLGEFRAKRDRERIFNSW